MVDKAIVDLCLPCPPHSTAVEVAEVLAVHAHRQARHKLHQTNPSTSTTMMPLTTTSLKPLRTPRYTTNLKKLSFTVTVWYILNTVWYMLVMRVLDNRRQGKLDDVKF